ncbi:hypothetical protein LUZ60_012899 [Juncus effusus]|nr:hypothetical protein LUZ60_012899 [Juncus effusus]
MTRDSCMQVLPPSNHHYANPNSCHFGQKPSTNWTREENKQFEDALALFGPDKLQKVAERIGKTDWEVKAHYNDLEADVCRIEAGLFHLPGYNSSLFTLGWDNNHAIQGIKFAYSSPGGKKPPLGGFRTGSEQERKKGIPWTQEEHRLFLVGLKEHGKGDWRNISRNYVMTRTPTQVASHAQKYFIRQKSANKEKRRPSIHDITTNNLAENRQPPSQAQQQSSDPALLNSSFFASMVDLKPKIDSKYFNSSCHGNLFVQPN